MARHGGRSGDRNAGGRRLFVAIDLPAPLRAELAALAQMLPVPRRAAPETLHLTLVFLGPCPETQLEEIDRALTAVTARGPAAFDLTLQGLGLFGRAAPRVVWAGLAPNPDLMDLQARLETALRRASCGIDHRRFQPHVTLARFAPAQADAPALEQALADLSGFRSDPWRVQAITLFQSWLRPEGPQHVALADYPLPGTPVG